MTLCSRHSCSGSFLTTSSSSWPTFESADRHLARRADRVGDLVAAHAVAGDRVLGELEQVTVGVLQQLGELLGGDVPRLDEGLAGRHALIGIRTDRRRFGERDTAPATLFDVVVCLLASKCHVIVVPVV